MISKGTTHNNGARLASYLTTGKDGERAELWQLRGFEATNIRDAFRDVQIMAGATQCEQPFFHVQVRNRDGETLTRYQWEEAADRIERMLGLKNQPRAIAFHIDEKSGHEHMHVAWSRIDQENLKALPLPFFKARLKKISRELEVHFALEPVTNRRPDKIKYAPTRAEEEQARRLGFDIHEVRSAIRTCYERSDCGASVVWSAAYNPFGDTSAFGGTLTTQSIRLPGQYFDPETGNNHNGFRDYAGTLTRYVQSDPIGLAGGMNTYQYVRANPFKYTDRLGLDPNPLGGQCPAGGGPAGLAAGAATTGGGMCTPSDNPDDSDNPNVPSDGPNLNDCIEECSDIAIPTRDHGFNFWNCVNQCMGINDHPDWTNDFPSSIPSPSPAAPSYFPPTFLPPIPSAPGGGGGDPFKWLHPSVPHDPVL